MTETFEAFTKRVSSFDALSPSEKICHAAWFLHEVKGTSHVSTKSINDLFAEIHAVPPPTSLYLKRMSDKKPPVFIKSKSGFKLENRPRNYLSEKYGKKESTIAISGLLSGLLTKVSEQIEIEFLEETLRCYSVKSFRASIVMSWNLAYSHILRHILSNQENIDKFNASLVIKYPKKNLAISGWDDFYDLKEFETIEICQHARLLTKNLAEILKEKLKRRNAAAHPSKVVITQAQADDVITDLVNNVVLAL